MDYIKIITSRRRHSSSVPGRNLAEELASDRARIIYSSPFRRLAQKAQVFSLEGNASVRNRITHSLEVSDIGRWIAYYVTEELIKTEKIKQEFQLPIIYAVENACLLHDIGNPPFGHFGEAAIQRWFRENWQSVYAESKGISKISESDKVNKLIKDFLEFDGNPQGLRIVLRLQRDKDEFGLNLTYTTILSLIKYARSSSEEKNKSLKKKPGYFESERDLVLKVKRELGISEDARYPLAYIMEAADDIAYCISDMEDGIEKEILTVSEFFYELSDEWRKIKEYDDPETFPLGDTNDELQGWLRFFEFKTSYARDAIAIATRKFLDNSHLCLTGSLPALFAEDTVEGRAIKCLKNVARRKLFRSSEAENPELAGYRIITGLLDHFKPLLTCSETQFKTLLEGRDNPSEVAGRGLDMHWRLFNKLPRKHLAAYEDQIKNPFDKDIQEWYFRAHLIVDFIAGMTDRFSMELYQLLSGIRLT
jgi:dGTPase